MNTQQPNKSVSKTIGWVLSGLLTAFMLFSAVGKFTTFEGKAEMFAKMEWSEAVMFNIGIVEITITAMFLVPRMAFTSAILLTAYLGGAVATHVRVNEAFVFPIIISVIYWVALGLRDKRVFALAFALSK